ncbi:alcohol dehydrogenase YqhD (iron-dependent ADH family) [Pullulanibacillus pueri]|uniref:NADH-dependent alcohol dehydrogenase n=1 Tax=Pullulanibacillus pueri TaxID=1437324 RepID=A0A8J3EKL2_9BACL|nr:iron-containing alcohol dehydrogenase [Pullulanibacillus pueri]MBM7680446.1 alcohol dehydrogenase YqhD (iron-dependent ADH family) [Pullulanibacillus pueri]GGH75044.1 NADH-dependent alcohol dehydrogenase [Pullulanibacillus pueri]
MDNFVFENPTKLIFGKDQIEALRKEVPQYGNKVLIVYGGGSVKRNGLLDQVKTELEAVNASAFELGGVEPNPRVTTVNKGADICKKENIDLILAVGGGSVIDCAKTIAAAAKYDGDAWDLVTRKAIPTEALPLGVVLTLAATGSEMNSGAVITNWETNEKYGWGSPLLFPKFSILDPQNTYTVPKDQTVYGIVDMMSHVLEQYYFHSPNSPLQERLCESVMQTVIETAPKLINDLQNYEYRETILYCGTMALNNMIRMGTKGDWGTHNLEHAVSAVYDIPHGGGLAILFPNWLKYTLDQGLKQTKQLAIRVFNVNPEGKSDRDIALEGIEKLRAFWDSIGAPSTLREYNINDEKLELMVDRAMANGPFGGFATLDRKDVAAIYKMAL